MALMCTTGKSAGFIVATVVNSSKRALFSSPSKLLHFRCKARVDITSIYFFFICRGVSSYGVVSEAYRRRVESSVDDVEPQAASVIENRNPRLV